MLVKLHVYPEEVDNLKLVKSWSFLGTTDLELLYLQDLYRLLLSLPFFCFRWNCGERSKFCKKVHCNRHKPVWSVGQVGLHQLQDFLYHRWPDATAGWLLLTRVHHECDKWNYSQSVCLISDINGCLLSRLHDEVLLSCSECVAVPSVPTRTTVNLCRSTSSSIHLHVWRLPREVVLQRQSRNYTQMCSSSKDLFTNVPWTRQVSDQQNSSCGRILLMLLMEGKATMKWVFIVDEATRRGEKNSSTLSKQNSWHLRTWSVFEQHSIQHWKSE